MPKRQTSSRIASIAGRLLDKLPRYRATVCCCDKHGVVTFFPLKDIRAVCASALSQDEAKRLQSKPKRRRARL